MAHLAPFPDTVRYLSKCADFKFLTYPTYIWCSVEGDKIFDIKK